jgi:hypothetical protein
LCEWHCWAENIYSVQSSKHLSFKSYPHLLRLWKSAKAVTSWSFPSVCSIEPLNRNPLLFPGW